MTAVTLLLNGGKALAERLAIAAEARTVEAAVRAEQPARAERVR
jgi:hypothetical protein